MAKSSTRSGKKSSSSSSSSGNNSSKTKDTIDKIAKAAMSREMLAAGLTAAAAANPGLMRLAAATTRIAGWRIGAAASAESRLRAASA